MSLDLPSQNGFLMIQTYQKAFFLKGSTLLSVDRHARVAGQLGLGDHIRLGKQAHEDGGRESTNILSDAIRQCWDCIF